MDRNKVITAFAEELQALHRDLQRPGAQVEITQAQINELWDLAVLLHINKQLHAAVDTSQKRKG